MLSPERVDRLFQPLERFGRLLVAVSGGPDSTALLAMLGAWARRNGGPALSAATVDHGLRPESAAEAAAVGALCARLGLAHATLAWRGDKPKTRLQELARAARYGLLIDHAKAVGAQALVTAHHQDDQAETVLMRLARGSGVAGLAGMAALAERDGVALTRPLLEVSKAELVAHCQAEGLPFSRDPSNADDRFARARLRKLMAAEGLDAAALARLARRAAQAEEALRAATAAAEERLHLIAAGECAAAALIDEPREIAQRLIAAAMARLSGREASRIGLEKLETLVEALVAAARGGRPFSANIAGVRARLTRGRLRLEPEPPRRIASVSPR